jgi:hypothetical protein
LYVKLAHWHRAAKHYIRDFTPDFISPDFKLIKASKIEPHELMSADIQKDKHVRELLEVKHRYALSLRKKCAQALETGSDTDQLETLKKQCEKVGQALKPLIE